MTQHTAPSRRVWKTPRAGSLKRLRLQEEALPPLEPHKIRLIPLILTLLFFSSSTWADSPQKYIGYQEGNLPILISAPHGGALKRPGLPERANKNHAKNFTKIKDSNTREIALALAKKIEKLTGKKPYVVVNNLHRKFMDANRIPEEAYEHPGGKEVYDLYHGSLKKAIGAIKRKFKYGILMDVHGQTRYPAAVYLGTHHGKTFSALQKKYGPEVLEGKRSIGALLAQYGYSTPGFAKKVSTNWWGKKKQKESRTFILPAKSNHWLGGAIVKLHGSHTPQGIDAMQVEIHTRIRLSKKAREKFSSDMASIIVIFAKKYLGI